MKFIFYKEIKSMKKKDILIGFLLLSSLFGLSQASQEDGTYQKKSPQDYKTPFHQDQQASDKSDQKSVLLHDSEYENTLIESGEFYKPKTPFLQGKTFKIYKLQKPLASQSAPLSTPLTAIDSDRFEWSMKVAEAVNHYFNLPYSDAKPDSNYYALQCPDGSFVYRPNHSLAHGMRQAYLAVDIAVFLKNSHDKQLSNHGKAFYDWVQSQFSKDPTLLKKLEFANAFQRSGRKSELSRDQNPEKYEEYLRSDQNNLQEKVGDFIGSGKLFKDQDEVDTYKGAIVKVFDIVPQNIHTDLYYLSKICFTAHLLDLRRLPHFDKEKILRKISLQLFGTVNPTEVESQIIEKLWNRAGDYLEATGDRDMDNPKKYTWDSQVFSAQAHNPRLMIHALQMARTKPEKKLLESIVDHVQAIREINEIGERAKKKSGITEESPVRSPSESRALFEKVPYTASEGYLKILLEDQYQEIPADASEDIARQITIQNVTNFLAEKKRIQDPKSSQKVFVARIEAPDEHYIHVLVDCMMEERRNRGKIVLYHATEPEMGFLIDVFSHLRKQIHMKGGKDITALRVLDDGFLKLDDYVRVNLLKESSANVLDFMIKFQGIADDNTEYRDMVLSTNFGLFGSDQQVNADTYNMFYEVKDRKVVTQALIYDKFFDFIEQKSGIPLNYNTFKPILDRFVLQSQDGRSWRNGRLLQIFIDPDVLLDTTYLSVLMGAPVLKEGTPPTIDIPLGLLRTEPKKLLEYLQGTSGSVNMDGVPSYHLRPGTLKLHDLQARFFMRPEIMFNSQLVTIKNYWRFNSPPKQYFDQIASLANQSLVTWLQKGCPADPYAFVPKTNTLKDFTQTVYRGSTGSDAPTAPPVPLEKQFVNLLVNDQKEQAARMLEENYEVLAHQGFTFPPTRSGWWKGLYSLLDIIKIYHSPSLFKVAFEKGLIAGGEEAYQIVLLVINTYALRDVLQTLASLKHPQDSSRLFLHYFKDTKFSFANDVLKAIGAAGNDESIIKMAQPFIDLFNHDYVALVLNGITQIPEPSRQSVCNEAMSYIKKIIDMETSDIEDSEKWYFAIKIDRFLMFILETQGQFAPQREYLWLTAKHMQASWDHRLKVVNLLKNITWIPDPIDQVYNPSISAPFDPDQIVCHAQTKPEIYEMEFLESDAGKDLISEIILQLNSYKVPKDDFASLSLAYDRGNPNAGYNKSLIAHYVSELVRRARR